MRAGSGERIRTAALPNMNRVLCHLSYTTKKEWPARTSEALERVCVRRPRLVGKARLETKCSVEHAFPRRTCIQFQHLPKTLVPALGLEPRSSCF